MKRLIIIFGMALLAIPIFAQVQVSGEVVDAKTGDPIIGAAVLVRGTSVGTVTDMDGRYELSVQTQEAVLEFSYMGYVSQTLPASKAKRVLLSEDMQALEEVVVVGYGTQKKSVVTAAISKVTADDLEKVIPTRVDNMLKGNHI